MTAEDTIASEVRTFVLENLHSYTCKRDVDKVLADFASNIFFIPIGQTQSIRGLEELEPWLRHEFEQHPDPVDTEQLWEHVDVLGPALAVVNTATRLHFSKTVVMELRCTFVCEKQPDVGWQIVNLHGALPAQPPAEGELWSVDKLRARNEQLEREVAERTEQLARQKTELERAYREAQIEAALERVRARSMVMHQSNELSEVIAVVFNEMEGLGFAPSVCSIGIFDAATRASVWWMSDETGADFPDRYHVPDLDHPWYTGIFEAWQRREPSYVFELSGESKKRLGDLLFKESDFKDLPEASIEAMRAPERVIMHYASMNHGLVEVVTEEALPDNKVAILQRVASVIDLAYTRFDDLQQAEAQAREAQIEAALERVRSRTMGMQRSDELGETASILFQQIRDLGVQIWSSGFQIWNADGISTTAWMASPEGGHQPSWNLPHTGDCFHRQILEARQRGEDFFVFESEGTSLEEVYRYMMTLPSIREFFNDALKAGFTLPTFQITHCGFFSHGYLMFITLEQTYTRFLDLKQAEEQARESEIQLALERVRSRAMAMHRSDELPEAAGLLYKELMTLGITPVASGYVFLDEESEQGLVLAVDTFEDGTSHLSSWHVPSTEDPVLRHRYESWKRQEPLLRVELEGDPSIAHNRYIASFTPEIPEEVYENLPERLIYYTANFSHGYLFVITTEPIAVEEEKTLVRFAKVFEMTYRRFLDLQQAEARARDAEQQASIDRVRAEIASMRTAEDLDRITPLVWRELTTLNVPFFRCGVFIMDEAEEVVTAYLSTPEGGALARLRLPFDITEAIQETVAHWQRKQVFLDQWSREEFIGFMHTMMDQGILDASSDYRELNIPQGQLTLQFVPFAQGMLYIGSDDPCPTTRSIWRRLWPMPLPWRMPGTKIFNVWKLPRPRWRWRCSTSRLPRPNWCNRRNWLRSAS
jgi:hypothetical protein